MPDYSSGDFEPILPLLHPPGQAARNLRRAAVIGIGAGAAALYQNYWNEYPGGYVDDPEYWDPDDEPVDPHPLPRAPLVDTVTNTTLPPGNTTKPIGPWPIIQEAAVVVNRGIDPAVRYHGRAPTEKQFMNAYAKRAKLA